MTKSQMHAHFARVAMLDRIKALSVEVRMLQANLPGTKATTTPQQAPSARVASTRRRRRKPMTPAQRKAVSIRMTKYWAKRKKAS